MLRRDSFPASGEQPLQPYPLQKTAFLGPWIDLLSAVCAVRTAPAPLALAWFPLTPLDPFVRWTPVPPEAGDRCSSIFEVSAAVGFLEALKTDPLAVTDALHAADANGVFALFVEMRGR